MENVIAACTGCGAKNRIPAKKQHLHPRCGRCGEPVAIGSAAVPVSLGDSDFQQFIGSVELPVMVDFFAPTCGPCQALAPVIRDMAVQYCGRIVIATLDTSQPAGTAAHFQIRGVPSLLFFKNGFVADQLIGAPPREELVYKLESLLR